MIRESDSTTGDHHSQDLAARHTPHTNSGVGKFLRFRVSPHNLRERVHYDNIRGSKGVS